MDGLPSLVFSWKGECRFGAVAPLARQSPEEYCFTSNAIILLRPLASQAG